MDGRSPAAILQRAQWIRTDPKRFEPRVPSKHQKTISTIKPIRGMKASSHHQPLRSVSCSLRTPIASDGRNVAKLQIDEIG